jgi:hypothetical protein
MTQQQLVHELALATGESARFIHRHGFSLLEPEDRPPLVIDWDRLDEARPRLFPINPSRIAAD